MTMVTEDVLAAAMQTLQRQYDGEIDAVRGAVAQAQSPQSMPTWMLIMKFINILRLASLHWKLTVSMNS